MNPLISDHGKFMGSGGDENENSIVPIRLLHAELVKSRLRRSERISLQDAALNVDTNLAGGSGLLGPDGFHDPIVIELADKIFGTHGLPAATRSTTTKTSTASTKSAAISSPRRPPSPRPAGPTSDEWTAETGIAVTATFLESSHDDHDDDENDKDEDGIPATFGSATIAFCYGPARPLVFAADCLFD